MIPLQTSIGMEKMEETRQELPKQCYSYAKQTSPYCWPPTDIKFNLQQPGKRVSTIDGHCWHTLGATPYRLCGESAPSQKNLAYLALEFPTSCLLKGIPLGSKKLSILAQEKPGSWIAPTNSKERQKFMRQAKEKSVPTNFIKNSPPIFYCGDKTGKIKGIPVDGIVKNVLDSLLVHQDRWH
jgi:hypothetical protein